VKGGSKRNFPADNFCISPPALPRCRLRRGSRVRKRIRHGRCACWSAFPLAAMPTWGNAFPTPRPAIRHREPTGCWYQHRNRDRRTCARRPTQAINATPYEKLNFNFIRDIAPVAGIISTGEPIGSSQDRSRLHRLRQGQSPQRRHRSSVPPPNSWQMPSWRLPASARSRAGFCVRSSW
jgi:hypothetical protein